MNKESYGIIFGIPVLFLITCISTGDAQMETDTLITVNTDQAVYNYGDSIVIHGVVQIIRVGQVVTLVVTNPQGNIITVDQLSVSSDKSYSTEIQTLGSLWKKDNVYTIKVQYGTGVRNEIGIIVGNVTRDTNIQCGNDEFLASGYCIKYNIDNGIITGSVIDGEKNILTIMIESTDDGMLIIKPHTDVLRDVRGVMIDGEKSPYNMLDETRIQITFPKDSQKIEIYATSVVPEFGIVSMILIIGIIACIAILARLKINTRITH